MAQSKESKKFWENNTHPVTGYKFELKRNKNRRLKREAKKRLNQNI